MTDRYRFDPGRSRFTVQAFATGMLSVFAHSPTFAVREFQGELRFEADGAETISLGLTVPAETLSLVDRVRDADRHEIEGRMRREVLETAAYPEIAYQSAEVSADPIAPGRLRVRIEGRLSLHGVTQPHRLGGELRIFADGIRLQGECPLRMSDYRIAPVTALGGTIRLQDELKLSYDIAASPEAS